MRPQAHMGTLADGPSEATRRAGADWHDGSTCPGGIRHQASGRGFMRRTRASPSDCYAPEHGIALGARTAVGLSSATGISMLRRLAVAALNP